MSQKFVSGKGCQNPADLEGLAKLLDVERSILALPEPRTSRDCGRASVGRIAEALDLSVPGRAKCPTGALLDHRTCAGQLCQLSAAGTPSLLHTVVVPVTGTASARSRVAVSMASVPAASRSFAAPGRLAHHQQRQGTHYPAIRGLRPSSSSTLAGCQQPPKVRLTLIVPTTPLCA